MVRRTARGDDSEPEQASFELPSPKEHLLQIVDVYDMRNHPENFPMDDPDIVFAKCEVVGGPEEGRGLLHRVNLNDQAKGFWATRLFLKSIGEPYKGEEFPINTENWPGRQMFCTVAHNQNKEKTKTYANIAFYNFDKAVEQFNAPVADANKKEEVSWE